MSMIHKVKYIVILSLLAILMVACAGSSTEPAEEVGSGNTETTTEEAVEGEEEEEAEAEAEAEEEEEAEAEAETEEEAETDGEVQSGGTLVIGTTQIPRHLNPTVQSGLATGIPGTQLFASLLRYDGDWNPHPYLAESWEISDDGLQVTVHLVEGATFHDGEPITSEDVKFSIETVKANHPFSTMFGPVTEIETPDDLTAIIHLEHPHPAILLAMSGQLLVIIPEHIYNEKCG